MTGQIKNIYQGISVKARIFLILLTVLTLFLSIALLAKAVGGPSITISPIDGSIVNQVKPLLTAQISSDINNAKTVFKLNGKQVQPSYDSVSHTLTYIPDYDLADGNNTIDVTVYDALDSSTNTVSSFVVKTSRPQFSSITPVQAIASKSPLISLNVTDPDQFNSSSLKMTIDGVPVTANLTYKDQGYWYVGYEGWVWVSNGLDYTNGTVTFQTNNLSIGTHQVEVSLADKLNNVMNYRWSFDIALPPSITEATPADGSVIMLSQPVFSAKVLVTPDSGALDTTATRVLLDNLPLAYTFDSSNGLVTVSTPTALTDGKHTWQIDVKSNKGLTNTYKSTFNVDTIAPVLSVYPVTGTVINSNVSTMVGFDFSDIGGINEQSVEINIDGTVVPATIKYNEVWVYPPYNDPYMNGYDYTKGSIYYYLPSLVNSTHTATFKLKDKAGNQTVKTSSYTISIPFGVGNYQPASNSTIISSMPLICFALTNASAADWNSLKMSVDGIAVTPQIDAIKGIISYQTVTALTEGSHNVYVALNDTTGKNVTGNWSFSYYAPGPRLTLSPGDGTTVDNLKPNQDSDKVKINFSDLNSAINESSIVLQVNGQNVSRTITYNAIYDTNPYTGDSVFSGYDYSNGQIVSNSSFPDGIYSAYLMIKDKAGYAKEKNWNFKIAVPPQLTSKFPDDKASINTKKPHFKIQINDPNGPAIDQTSIKLYIDDTQAIMTYTPINQSSGSVEYDAIFSTEGTHTAKLIVADSLGNTSTNSWSFYINSYGEMAISPQSCSSCHSIDQYGKHVHTKGPDLELTGGTAQHGQTGTCGHCHVSSTSSQINDPNYCVYCHGDSNPMSAWPAAPSGSYPVQAGKSCFDCHTKKDTWTGASSMPVVTGYPNEVQPTTPVVHNIFGLHNVINSDCTACHADNLTREHNIRKDASGQPFTCNTCHSSTKPEVINAITNKKTDCSSCHQSAGHESVHVDSLDSNCQTCHKGTVSAEHLTNTKTQTKSLTCVSCHQSQRTDVLRAVNSGDLSCSACHDLAHGIMLKKVVPADVPLYPQLTWTAPELAAIWAGESWLPDDFSGAQIVISKRCTAITGDNVWSYYNQQLISKGWQLISTPPATGNNYFQATFSRNDNITTTERKVLILFYGGENHSAGPVLPAGYRVEIIFK